MQDIHSVGSGGRGRIFSRLGNRRLRPHSHQNHQQALKCPRCDSPNTKFCYYNNYNLSQPRHFCKSCRRYWTKGGVLRNVPVGGGCRKAKRSSKSKRPSSTTTEAVATSTPQRSRKSNSNSSSESSSLTATAATEVVSASSSNSATMLFKFPDSRFIIPQTTNNVLDPPLIDQSLGGGMFPEIGSFTNLMTTSNDPSPLGFNIVDISSYRFQHHNQGHVVENQSSNQQWHQQQQKLPSSTMAVDVKMQEMTRTTEYVDQTAQIELSGLQNRTSNGGLAAVDWHTTVDEGMFDLSGTVDQDYWNQTQWPDNDHSLHYLP